MEKKLQPHWPESNQIVRLTTQTRYRTPSGWGIRMIKTGSSFLFMAMTLALIACNREISEDHDEGKKYRSIYYSFGREFYCIPLDDFQSGEMVSNGANFRLSKKIFSRSDALLGEGGLIDRVRFFSGKGNINLKWSIPKGDGYYLRVLRCSDIFSSQKKIHGFGVFLRL